MDKNYKKILSQINTYCDVLMQQKLPTTTFNDILSRILSLRNQYIHKLDLGRKNDELTQFMNYLKSLIINREKNMPNTTFDSVLKVMTNLHKEYKLNALQYCFIDDEIECLDEIAKSMSNKTHSMTTRRLNEIAKRKVELQKQIDLTK